MMTCSLTSAWCARCASDRHLCHAYLSSIPASRCFSNTVWLLLMRHDSAKPLLFLRLLLRVSKRRVHRSFEHSRRRYSSPLLFQLARFVVVRYHCAAGRQTMISTSSFTGDHQQHQLAAGEGGTRPNKSSGPVASFSRRFKYGWSFTRYVDS